MEYNSGLIHSSLTNNKYYLLLNDFNIIISSGKRFDDMCCDDWDNVDSIDLLVGDVISIRYYKTKGGSVYCYLDFLNRNGFCCLFGVDTFISKGFLDNNPLIFSDVSFSYLRDKILDVLLDK
jgi:hypothetical protein